MSQLHLRATTCELAGKVFQLDTIYINTYTIGRNPDCSIAFPVEAAGVSRLHCKIVVEACSAPLGTPGTWFVKLVDFGSTFGTYLGDNTRLEPGKEYTLYAGDTFRLSPFGPEFRLEEVQ